jgi:hypothetical protein
MPISVISLRVRYGGAVIFQTRVHCCPKERPVVKTTIAKSRTKRFMVAPIVVEGPDKLFDLVELALSGKSG